MTDNPSPQARAVEVTQADRELFISLWEPTDELAEDVRNGRAFTGEVEEIARHRAQAEADALERAAKVADRQAELFDITVRQLTGPGADPNDERSHYLWAGGTARAIAAAIRAMKGQDNGHVL